MKKKILLWVVKIAAILVWVTTLFIPDVFEKIEDVHVVNYKEIKLEESSPTYKNIEVEFSENVLYGHIVVCFYDSDGELIHDHVILLEEGNLNFAEFEIECEKMAQSVRYEIEDVHVKTVNENKVDKISMVAFVIMFAVMIAIIRIDYKEQTIDNKTVEVYSGLIKHRVSVAGEKVFEEKWFTFKGKEVLLNLSETTDINVMFSPMNKIEVETISKPKIEIIKEEKKEEPEIQEKKAPKKKTTAVSTTGAKKVVSGASKKAKFQVKSTSKKQGGRK